MNKEKAYIIVDWIFKILMVGAPLLIIALYAADPYVFCIEVEPTPQANPVQYDKEDIGKTCYTTLRDRKEHVDYLLKKYPRQDTLSIPINYTIP